MIYSQKQFDNVTSILADIHPGPASFWIQETFFDSYYVWGSSQTPIDQTNFHNDTGVPFLETNCLVLNNSVEDGKYRFAEVQDCGQNLYVICQYPCGSTEGTISTVSKDPNIPVYDTKGSVQISCSPAFTPYMVDWYNNGTKHLSALSSNATLESPEYPTTLTLTCIAVGSDGQMVLSNSMELMFIGTPYVQSRPILSIWEYSTGTKVVLTCNGGEMTEDNSYRWMLDGFEYIRKNNSRGGVKRDYRGANLTSGYSTEHWQCRTELSFGSSQWSPVYTLTFYPGPAMPNISREGPSWVHYNSTSVTFRCHNTTVLTGSVKRYIWLEDEVEIPGLDTQNVSVNSDKLGFVDYACRIEDEEGNSTRSERLQQLYTVTEMCITNPCLNQGTCYAVEYDTSACSCVNGFEGDFCQTVTVIHIANTFDVNDETKSTTAIEYIISGVTADLLTNLTEDTYQRISMSAEAVVTYAERSMGNNDDPRTVFNLTAETMVVSADITSSMRKMDCRGSQVDMCDEHMIQSVFSKVEESIVRMALNCIQSDPEATVTLLDNNTAKAADMTVKNITISMAAVGQDMASGVMETKGAKVRMPQKLDTDNISLVSIQYSQDPYFHQNNKSNITVDGQVYHLHMLDYKGVTLELELDDPIEIDLEVSGHDTHIDTNSSVNSVHSIDLGSTAPATVVVVEYSVSSTQTLTLAAKRDAIPSDNDAEMNITIGSQGRIQENNNDVEGVFLYRLYSNILSIYIPLPNCSIIYFVSNYTDSSLENTTTVMSSIKSHGFYVNYWDPGLVMWRRATSAYGRSTLTTSSSRRKLLSIEETKEPVQVTDASVEGSVKFRSNILGSFSVSRFVIAPNLINFDSVLSNFGALLADTPQVLALNCCLFFVAILLVIVIRRADLHDQLLWTYLPLVDNDNRDKDLYTLSVHTAIDSPPCMTATPYFLLKGERGMTYKRMLFDGVRQNFSGGTVSNFVVHTPYWLGRLLSIKIWTDGVGEQPDWKLDRVVVSDIAADENYVFLCQDWLALSRGKGELCHEIHAIGPTTDENDLDPSIISKSILYDDHVWLSVTKRPGYSTFSRVQRFVCDVALLYLAMLTNAMFYPTGNSDSGQDSQSTGLKIRPLEFGYREVYVGIVSAIVIVIPGFFMTWAFTHRRFKGQNYEIVTPQSRSPSLATTSTTLSTDSGIENDGDTSHGTTASTAAIFSEVEPVNYSIAFLKKVFYEYEQQTGEAALTNHKFSKGIKEDVLAQTKDQQSQMENRYTEFFEESIHEEEDINLRNRKWVIEKGNQNKPFMLPWWFIFIAYGVAIASIATAAVLTIFYSLEWGNTTSNRWLMSLFFSTSASTFVIEPIKILVVAIILSCLFKKFSNKGMSCVAPFDRHKVPDAPPCPIPPVVEEPDTNSKEMKKRKEDLKLRHKMVGVWKSIGFRITMVVVCGIVALHLDVQSSYYQNAHVKTWIDKDHLEDAVRTESDLYAWLSDKLISQTIPLTLYNGQSMTSYQTRFAQDQVHYRLGPVRVIQFRVKDTFTCEVRSELHSYLKSIICLGNYNEDTEEYREFAVNWTSCANRPCSGAYEYKSGEKWIHPVDGKTAVYGPGGYQVLWNGDQQQTMVSLSRLEGSEWMDERSRGIGVELTVFNPSTRLFTQAKTLIELPPFGSTIMTVTVKSARLYPFITVWDYLVLFVHLFFTVLQIIRMCMMVSVVIKPENRGQRWSFGNLVVFVDVSLALVAFIAYVIRLVLTSELLERVINETDKFSSFDNVFLLDQTFVICMSMCLFIAILMCLSPLSLNYNLYIMKQTVSTSSPQLSGFAFLLVIFLFAFATYFTIARGSVTKNLCSFADSLMSLLTVVLGHGKFRGIGGESEMANTSGVEFIIFRFMYGAFCFGSAIFMINLAITILSAYITEVKDACYKKRGMHSGYDPKLNQFMWDNIEQWIKILFLRNSKNLDLEDNHYSGSRQSYLPGTTKNNTSDEFLRKGKFF